MSFRVEPRLPRRAWLGSARAEGRDIISVAGAVKGGRSPAKRTLYSVRNANTLKGLGPVAAVCGQFPPPRAARTSPPSGAGLGVGRPKGSTGGVVAQRRFHTKRSKPRKRKRSFLAPLFFADDVRR